MKCNMIILPMSGGRIIQPVEFKTDEPTYAELRALIVPEIPSLDDGNFEHVTVLYGDRRCDMFVDETGVNRNLGRNKAATDIYRASWMKRHPGEDPETLPAIEGVAVVFDVQVWF